jgi:coenzyme PQQ precursor peptide PqqA
LSFLQRFAKPVGTISKTQAFNVCLPRFKPGSIVAACGTGPFGARGDLKMAWKTPKIVEVPVGMEINMYACAARK